MSKTYTQILITEESFDDESNGDITGVMTNGEPWEANTFGFCGPDNPGNWGVDNGEFICNNVEGFDCCGCGPFGFGAAECGDNKNEINFGPIDISSFQGLLFDFNVNIVGDLECSSIGGSNCPSGNPYNGCIGGGNDQIVLSYSIDGGAYENAIYYCGEQLCFDEAPIQCGLDAQSLIIRIRMGTQQYQEFYKIESLSLFGYPKTSANAIATPTSICEGGDIQLSENGGDAVSWLWSGPDGFTSAIQNPLLNNVTSNKQGTYTVTITDINDCTVESSIDISIIDAPTASLTGTIDFCQGDCYPITTNMSEGTEPYEAFFTLTVGSFNVPFSIASYDINNELSICYSGTLEPYYDNNNTIFIPTSLSGVPFTEIGTLTLTGLIDDNNCEAQIINPNNIILNFKEKLDISTAGPLEECDDNNDGIAIFDLSELDNIITGGSTTISTNWFIDNECSIPITDPSFHQTTTTTTIYVFLTDDEKCNSDTIPIDLLVFDLPFPGEDNNDTFCGAPEDLIDIESYLGVNFDVNGTWSNFDGIDISDINNVDLSSAINGVYSFYYEILNPPCDLQQAIITIEIKEAPNAGQNNELFVCNSGINTFLDLEDALGNHDSNGDWEDNDGSGVDLSIPSSVDFEDVTTDTFHYSYIVPVNGFCLEDTATITVIIEKPTFAGVDGSESICTGLIDTINLYEYIGQNADSTGIWSQIGGHSIDITRPDTMIFTLEPVGIDSFLYVTLGPCGSDSAFVYININASPNAGSDYIYTVCIGQTINLYDSLTNFYIGGTWLDSNLDTIFNPENISLNKIKTYSFSYIIPENGTCSGDTAEATIVTIDAPEAGIGENFSVCQGSSNTINLFDYISENSQTNGFWIDNNNVVISNPNNFNFSSYNPGEYSFSYILESNGYCLGDSASLSVLVLTALEAGTNNSFTVCNGEINNFVNLDSLLGVHDNSGNWINENSVNVDIINIKKIDFTNINEGSYQFKYLIDANGTCPADSAIITIDVVSKLSAGNDKELTFCEGGSTLVSLLDELKPNISTQYIIEDLNQSGALNDQTLMIDISLLQNDTYAYSLVTGQGDLCGMDTSYLAITIVEAYDAGEPNNLEVCNGDVEFDLDLLLGVHDGGGIWLDLDNSNVDVMSSSGKLVSFKDIDKGIYRFEYKIEASGTCPESSAIITVEVKPVTYSNYTQEVCPGQIVTIGNTNYSLNNPTGEEFLANIFDCDSIVSVNLTPKQISSSFTTERENCFGFGKFVLQSMNNAVLPIMLSIENIADYQISSFPFILDDLSVGDYNFEITDSDGCISDVNTPFSIDYFTPFEINIDVTTNKNAYSLNVSTNINSYSISWSPNAGLSCSNCLNPIANPETDQEYIVTIIDEEGCSVSDTIFLNAIEIEVDVSVDIPNIFTPNDDGNNDVFYAKSNIDNYKYSLAVYNRWGEKIYNKIDLLFNDSKNGWDGFYKGKKLNPGVYIYVITFYNRDDQKEVRAGDVLLLK